MKSLILFAILMSAPVIAEDRLNQGTGAKQKIEMLGDFSLVCYPPSESMEQILHLHFLKDADYVTTHRIQMHQPIEQECRPALKMKDNKKPTAEEWNRTSIFLRCDDRNYLDIDRIHGTVNNGFLDLDGGWSNCEVRDFTDQKFLRETKF